jgi:N-acetylneuraminic acid mutarotase
MKKSNLWLLALVFSLVRCADMGLHELNFVSVNVLPTQFENFNAAVLEGQVLDLGDISAGECGFLWAYERDIVEDSPTEAQWIPLPLSALESDGRFRVILDNLDREKTIFIRAFVRVNVEKTGERLLYSEKTESFSVGEIVANTGKAQVFNDSAVVYGQLRRGSEAQNQDVAQRGHVISAISDLPRLGCQTCRPFNGGSSNDDDVFSSHFSGLEFNTKYFSRAYAIAGNDTFYAQTVDTIFVQDGWEPVESFPYGYTEGGATTLDNKAYAGFGCKNSQECMDGELSTDFWQFDPAGNGHWMPTTSLTAFTLKRYNATVFGAGDFIHAIFGEVDQNGESNVLNEFSRLNPNSGTWTEINLNNVFPDGRTGAVAFSIAGKVYIGSGRDENFLELRDFQEYDPATGHWRAVAPISLKTNPAGDVYPQGRFNAVAFTSGNYGYVGCGQWGQASLRDFWRFRPPVDSLDMGEWTLETFLPPEAEARFEAVAFEIGGKGYVGSGYNPTEGYLKDWWQYNPTDHLWIPCALFPGLPRTRAMAFSLNEQGYFGTGQTKYLFNGGLNNITRTLADFWRYIPAK